ncbi:MAG: VOC family protein [Pseudomonadota bacterium]
MPITLEHVNMTVPDNAKTAAWMQDVFGWHIRWQGDGMGGAGSTIHVGTDTSYIALYSPNGDTQPTVDTYHTSAGLNHVALVVDDLDAAEDRVKAAGFTPQSHADYEPGRRFYFYDDDGLEFELVQYD